MAATVHMGEGRGFTLPTWFLGAAVACFFTVSVSVFGVAITVWSDVRASTAKNIDQDERIKQLEQLKADFAGMKSDIANTRDLAQQTNGKIDKLIEFQLESKRHD
jgi:hypothetical protein